MTVVQVTGNLWDHTGSPIPADKHPQLGFRPERSSIVAGGMAVGVEAIATLNASTGAFSVSLIAEPYIVYRPFLTWLIAGGSDPQDWARGYAEWDWTINPYPNGGLIDELAPTALTTGSVLISLDDPPPGYRGWYLNAPGPGQPLGDPDDVASSGTGILEIVS